MPTTLGSERSVITLLESREGGGARCAGRPAALRITRPPCGVFTWDVSPMWRDAILGSMRCEVIGPDARAYLGAILATAIPSSTTARPDDETTLTGADKGKGIPRYPTAHLRRRPHYQPLRPSLCVNFVDRNCHEPAHVNALISNTLHDNRRTTVRNGNRRLALAADNPLKIQPPIPGAPLAWRPSKRW